MLEECHSSILECVFVCPKSLVIEFSFVSLHFSALGLLLRMCICMVGRREKGLKEFVLCLGPCQFLFGLLGEFFCWGGGRASLVVSIWERLGSSQIINFKIRLHLLRPECQKNCNYLLTFTRG